MGDTPPTQCRLLSDPPSDGAWNMAVDDYLLGWTARTGRCCWRFYQWREPTLSLGYFQQYGDRRGHPPSSDCRVVRRASGGGAILHDGELTYSLTVPNDHPLARRRQWTYEAVHETLIAVLGEMEIEAALFGNAEVEAEQASQFLCFNRRSVGDVVVDGVKVAGSAQRRIAGAVLQHGSVLLRRAETAPELAGLEELSGKKLDVKSLIDRWRGRLASVLQLEWAEEALTAQECEQVEQIVAGKFGDLRWTEKRSR